MSATDELNQWITEHGSERDALNVALARLHLAETDVDLLVVALEEAQDDNAELRREYLELAGEILRGKPDEPCLCCREAGCVDGCACSRKVGSVDYRDQFHGVS
jgi:hypothetical protein